MEGRQGAAVTLDDVMPSCAEEVLPITALLNDSRLACIGGFSTVHSEVQSTVTDIDHLQLIYLGRPGLGYVPSLSQYAPSHDHSDHLPSPHRRSFSIRFFAPRRLTDRIALLSGCPSPLAQRLR